MLNKATNYFDLNDTKRNQRLTYLSTITSVIFIIIILVVYVINNKFTVDKIVVKGDLDHVTKTQLEYVANNKLHGTFFTLNIEELKSQFKLLPWVKDVTVERVFPHEIIVKYTEYKAIARVGNDDLLADNLEVFDGADNNSELPVLNVSAEKANWAYQKYLEINKAVTPYDLKVKSIDSENPRLIKAKLSNGLEMVFCTQNLNDSLNKIQMYWSELQQIHPNAQYMNFCYANSVAVK